MKRRLSHCDLRLATRLLNIACIGACFLLPCSFCDNDHPGDCANCTGKEQGGIPLPGQPSGPACSFWDLHLLLHVSPFSPWHGHANVDQETSLQAPNGRLYSHLGPLPVNLIYSCVSVWVSPTRPLHAELLSSWLLHSSCYLLFYCPIPCLHSDHKLPHHFGHAEGDGKGVVSHFQKGQEVPLPH